MTRTITSRKSRKPLKIVNKLPNGGEAFTNFMNGSMGKKIDQGTASFDAAAHLIKGEQPSILDYTGASTSGSGLYGAIGSAIQDTGNIISGISTLVKKKKPPLERTLGLSSPYADGGFVRKFLPGGEMPAIDASQLFTTPNTGLNLNIDQNQLDADIAKGNADFLNSQSSGFGLDDGLGITKGVAGIVGDAIQTANNIRDTSSAKEKIAATRFNKVDDSSLDAVQNAASNVTFLNNITKSDLKNTNVGQDIGGVFKSMGQGAKTGSVLGPWGAVGGAAVGLLGSTFGLIGKNRKLINETRKMNRMINSANSKQSQDIANAAENAYQKNNFSAMANYQALGGPLYPYAYNPAGLYSIGDALPYGYMQDRLDLAQQKLNAEGTDTDLSNVFASGGGIHINPKNKGKLTATAKRTGKSFSELAHSKNPTTRKRAQFALNARHFNHKHKHALGGDLQSNGADWDLGFTTIGNGGTHEMNPNEGVQMGMDNQGVPNLVEQGEVIYNNYVFSNRLSAPKELLKQIGLPSSYADMSFAKIAEKISKENEERPNDPISKRGLDANMGKLMQAQEYVRQQEQADKTKEMINNMSPEELQGLMAMANQGMQQQAQDQAMQEQMAQEQMMAQQGIDPNALGAEALYGACGGRLGKLYKGTGNETQQLVTPSVSSANYGATFNPGMWIQFLAQNKAALENSDWYKNYLENSGTHNSNWWLSDFLKNNPQYLGPNSSIQIPQAFIDAYDENYQNPKPLVNAPKEGVAGVLPYLEKYFALTNNPELLEAFKSAAGDADENGNYNFVGSKGEGLNQYMYNLWKSTQKGNNPIDLDALPSDIQDYIAAQEDTRKGNKLAALRYAGIVPQLIGLGLSARKPNNSYAERLIEAAQNTGYMPVKAEPIGNYLQYTPIDRNFYTNQLAAQANAQRRALINLSNANRGTAAANILASDYNNTKNLGDLAFNAEKTNWERRKDVGEFNRGTNQFNSQQALEAARANQNAALSARNANLSLLAQGLGWQREDEKERWSNIVGNLGQIGKYLSDVGQDTLNNNLVKTTPGIDYAATLLGQNGYQNMPVGTTKAKSAYGGRLRKNRRRRNA